MREEIVGCLKRDRPPYGEGLKQLSLCGSTMKREYRRRSENLNMRRSRLMGRKRSQILGLGSFGMLVTGRLLTFGTRARLKWSGLLRILHSKHATVPKPRSVIHR